MCVRLFNDWLESFGENIDPDGNSMAAAERNFTMAFSEIFIGGMTFDNPGETMVGPSQFEFWLQQRRYSNNGYENSITQLRLQLFYNKCC